MTTKETILKCILILYFQTIVNGNFKKEKPKPKIFQVVESKNRFFLQNDENNNYNPEALVSFLNKNADVEYKVNNKEPKTSGLKRILIKRKIPHGLETPSLEHDHLHNTLYRPLVRYHKTKKNYQNSDFSDYENNDEDVTFVGKNLVNKRLKNNRDYSKELLLQPFNYRNNHKKQNYLRTKDYYRHESRNSEPDDYTENNHKSNRKLKIKPRLPMYPRTKRELTIELLKELNELTRSVKCKKLGRKIRAEVSEMLDQLTQLRTGRLGQPLQLGQKVQYVKSGEQNDPLKRYDALIRDKNRKKNDKKYYMHAPFYHDDPITNFWTYKKTIPIDDCPGQLIKIGNVCAKAPPH